MPYGELITRSWTIFWRHRYLWLLGALGGSLGGGSGFSGNFGGGGGGGGAGPGSPELGRWISDNLGLLIGLGVLVFLLFLVYVLVVASIAVGALVRAAAEHDAERPFGLGPAWQAGLQIWLRVLGLRVVAGLCFLAVALVFTAAVVLLVLFGVASANSRQGGGVALAVLLGIGLAAIFIVAAIAYSLVVMLATISLVLEQRGIFASFFRGFRLFFNRLGRVLLVWLISIPLSIVIGIATAVAAAVVAVPLVLIGVAVYAGLGLSAALTVAVVLLLLFTIGAIALSGAAQSYLTVYWTLAFRRLELDAPPVPAFAYGQPPTPA